MAVVVPANPAASTGLATTDGGVSAACEEPTAEREEPTAAREEPTAAREELAAAHEELTAASTELTAASTELTAASSELTAATDLELLVKMRSKGDLSKNEFERAKKPLFGDSEAHP